MRLGRNLAAGLGHALVTMVVGVAVVPFYLRYLGVEAYGLIGFHVTLQGVLQLLELGLGPVISREIARGTASGEMGRARNLLHSLGYVYWGVALLIGLVLALAAPGIARHWLNAEQIDAATITNAVLLMGLLIAIRWPSSLYFGALTGAHRLTVASALASAALILGNVGAVAVLAFVSPTLEAYFLWQAGIGLAYTLAIQIAAWRMIGGAREARFDPAALKTIWRFTLGVSGVVATGTLVGQLDKILLSNLVTLEEFATYMLATLLAGILYRLITPLFNVMYPRFSALVATGDEAGLLRMYRGGTAVFAMLWFPAAMALAVCAEPVLLLWTGDAVLAADTAPVLALLAIGTALHGVMYFPYALQLAHGMSRLPLTINGILVVVQLPLVLVLASRFGTIGAAAAWLALHILYIFLGTWLTHRRLLTGLGRAWLGRDVGVPLLVSGALGLAASRLLGLAAEFPAAQLAMGAAAAFLALLISAAFCPYKPRDIKAALAA